MGKIQTALKRACLFLIILSAAVPAGSAETGETNRSPLPAEQVIQGPLSLAEALTIANEGNFDLAMAAHRIESAAAAIKQAQSAFYPLLGFSLEYMQTRRPSILSRPSISANLNRAPILTSPAGLKTGKPLPWPN